MKEAHPTETVEAGLKDSADFIPEPCTSPRQQRALRALIESPNGIVREELDRVVGASNGPELVACLRRRIVGYDGLLTERLQVIDRDGKVSKPGRYWLTAIGRQRAALALALGGFRHV